MEISDVSSFGNAQVPPTAKLNLLLIEPVDGFSSCGALGCYEATMRTRAQPLCRQTDRQTRREAYVLSCLFMSSDFDLI